MPNDLVSREAAVATTMEAIADIYVCRQWASTDDFRFMTTKAVAVAIANLPAAGDERWEKLRAFIEIYRPSCGDTEYAVALQNACDAIENELDRLSPPQQEAGDEPGKCGTDYKAPGKRTGKTTIERVVSPC